MERSVGPSFEDIRTCRIKLGVQSAEGVMDRGGTEHPHTPSLSLLNLKPLCLYDDTEAFDKEDTAQDREQQFLMNDDGTDTNDTTDGERTGVTHENLCRVGIIPQETNHGTDKSTEEDNQLLRALGYT